MLKQYRAAVIGVVCMLASIVLTGLISLKDEQPAENTQQTILAEQSTTADKEKMMESPVLALSGSAVTGETGAEEVMQPVIEQQTAGTAEQETTEAETTPAQKISEPETVATAGQETTTEPEAAEPQTTEPETTEPETTVESSEFDGYILPDVEVYLNIRETPSTDGVILGKLYVGSMAEIVEEMEGWMLVKSGNVEGYVNSDYIVTGKEAEELAREDGKTMATVLEGGLRVRETPGTDADVLSVVGEGEQFEVAEEIEGWVGIRYTEDTVAYLSADYVDVGFELGEAISIEEEQEAIRRAEEEAARRAEEEARAIEQAKAEAAERLANSAAVETVVTEGYTASYDDTYLLACLVHMESAGEPYEGKLAVANVVLNRLKSGYGSTISEIIYAKNQFTGANTGALANIMAEGPTDECMQAAVEALSGVNNIGDYKNFIALSWANFDSYSEYTIIENHCFYKR